VPGTASSPYVYTPAPVQAPTPASFPTTPTAPTTPVTPTPVANARIDGGRLDMAVNALTAAIRGDAQIMAAFQNWGGLSTDQKLEVAKAISRLQGQAFGFTPVTDIRYDATLDARGLAGLWSSDNVIKVSGQTLSSPQNLVRNIAHEQAHAYDHATNSNLAAHNHNSGNVDDAVYRIGYAVRDGVFGTQTA